MSAETKKPAPGSNRTRVTEEQSNLHTSEDVHPWTIPARDAIQVFTSESGNVVIRQPTYPGDDDVVIVHPDDVPRLVRMLRLARQALKGAGNG